MAGITLVIAEINNAYEKYNAQAAESMSESDIKSVAKDIHEPPTKQWEQEIKGVIAGMAKVVNKFLHNGENHNADRFLWLTNLLCNGASKEFRGELVENTQPRETANALKSFYVNPDIFNSVRKDVKTNEVVIQKAHKPLSKGITAMAERLTDLLVAREAKD